jgi:hypothetical protein
MQLGGTLFAALSAMYTLIFFMAGGHGGGSWLGLIMLLGVARSLVHNRAGTQILYGSQLGFNPDNVNAPSDRTKGVRTYVIVAVIHSILVGAIVKGELHMPGVMAFCYAAGLLVWPLFVSVILAAPGFREVRERGVPMPEDKGFEGASVYMLIFGAMGSIAMAALVYLMIKADVTKEMIGMVFLLCMITLLIRSIMHAHAGLSGLGSRSLDRAVELAKRYANFGVISSIGIAAVLFMMILAMGGLGAGSQILIIMFVFGCFVWMLMAWPLAIRRFYMDREFSDMLTGAAAPVQSRAPDGAMSNLGWLLFAFAVINLAMMIIGYGSAHATPTMDDPDTYGRMGGGLGDFSDNPMALLGAFGGNQLAGTVWLERALLAVQLWAGLELIFVSSRHRIAGMAYAVAAIAAQIYMDYKAWQILKHLDGGGGMAIAMIFAGMAISLILPVVTLCLVNRKIRSAFDLGSVFA